MAYVEGSDTSDEPEGLRLEQTAESRELLRFSCGHEVLGASLREADRDSLTVEERTSEDASDTEEADERAADSRPRRSHEEKGG